jgi:ubiquinone/menaquinone biosynthesis C-methylase UbiE
VEIVSPTSPDAVEALSRLKALFQLDKDAVRSLFSEWFYTYHADVYVHGVPFEVYLRKTAAIVRELNGAQRVLDLGAGFGVYACLLRILGVPEVVAMDYHAQKACDAAKLVRHLRLDGLYVLQGDALALPFRGRPFDAALTLASLSHIREPKEALRMLSGQLRPGGRVYVFEDNNSSFPGYTKEMSRVWEAAESGQYQEGLPSEKQHSESYLTLRREMIRTRFPDLSSEALDHCARETRGLYGRKLIDTVEEYRNGSAIHNSRRHLVCHPVSGEYEEYPLNPGILKRMLRDAGFNPHLRSPHEGPFRGRCRTLKRIAAGLLRICPGLLPWASPTFAIVATLPGEAVRKGP